MKIIVAKNAGFCSGVKRAISAALSIDGGCVTLGKLIHNELVIKDLESHNIHSINSLEEYSSGVLLIRSHGVGKDTYEQLDKKNIPYQDATCVFVKKIHQIVEEYHKNGYKIIIIGDKKHPEVIGINGWCNNEAIVIDSEEEVSQLGGQNKYCLVSQTTYDTLKYKNIIKKVKNTCKSVEIKDTICYTTTCRQEEAYKLSTTCDVILVIGSKTSSNTSKLYNICKANCRTYLIENKADLESVDYKNISTLGIVAGASTPQELIMEVKTQMSESQETKIVAVENEVKENSFEAYMLSKAGQNSASRTSNMKKNAVYTVEVISATKDGISVNFYGKKDGFIPADLVEVDGVEYDPSKYVKGDKLRVKYIDNPGKNVDNSALCFSKKVIDEKEVNLKASTEILKQPEFKAVVTGYDEVKGKGLYAKVVPYSIFIPSSQVKIGKQFLTKDELKDYVGKELRLRVIKSKKDESEGDEVVLSPKNTVYASQRVVLEEERAAADKALWEVIYQDAIVTGKVVKYRDCGVFVNVNGLTCLVHISNVSHRKNFNPEEVLKKGKSYEFKVLHVDQENRKVSLGYKQLQKSLYEEAFEKYPVGSTITGVVSEVMNYGAYVTIEDGVDGLVPVSEMSHKYVKHPQDVCKIGDSITAQVIKFEAEKNKITLSMKALIEDVSEEVSEEEYKAAQEKRTAKNMKKFETAEAPKKRVSKKANQEEEPEETVMHTETSEATSIGKLIQDKLSGLLSD